MISQRRGIWTTATALTLLVGVAFMGGCGVGKGFVRTPESTTRVGTASRAQLIADLKSRMERLYTLTAKAHVEMVDQAHMRNGKFARTEVNGQLLLKRSPTDCRIRFSAQTFMPVANFTLLAKNENFWILMPDFTDNPNPDGKTGTVYVGQSPRNATRPRASFSYRPQDLADILLVDEAFDRSNIVYMETWKEYYILHFLRQDRPEALYSKIWVSRIGGNMAVHQIFDPNGELLVEGRFMNYKNYKNQMPLEGLTNYSGRDGNFSVPLPSQFSIIWPRDKLMLNIKLGNVRVNEEIINTKFNPVFPEAYRIFRMREDALEEVPREEALEDTPHSGR